jgi:hypothetical protein
MNINLYGRRTPFRDSELTLFGGTTLIRYETRESYHEI